MSDERCLPYRENLAAYALGTLDADESRPAVVMLYRKDEISKYAPEIVEYVNKKYKVAEEFDFISIYVPLNP